MVDAKQAAQSLSRLTVLKFFPADRQAHTAILELVSNLATDNAQIDWLVAKMLRTYNEWPGPREMRACFCSRYRPADGINAYSEVYEDGIPADREQLPAIEPPTFPALPAGHLATADDEFDRKVQAAAKAVALPPARPVDSRFARTLEETITPPGERPELTPAPKVFTQEDIDRALEEYRKSKTVV